VEERGHGDDVVFQTSVDQVVVVVDGDFIDGAAAEGQDTGPGDGEGVGFDA
jgi:hypothetical protein